MIKKAKVLHTAHILRLEAKSTVSLTRLSKVKYY